MKNEKQQAFLDHLSRAYQIKFDRIVPFSTVMKVYAGEKQYILKRVKSKRLHKNYNFLNAQKFAHVILPLQTVDYEYTTRFENDYYYLTPYYYNIDYPLDKRLVDYIELLVKLHKVTELKRSFDKEEFEHIYKRQMRHLNDRFMILDAFLGECETREARTVFMWYYLQEYQKLIGTKNLLLEIQKKIDEELPKIDQFTYSLIHNSPSIDHFIVTNEKNYLISLDQSVISMKIYDYIKLFIEYCEYPVNWFELLEREGITPFEFYIFCFNVVYSIVVNMDVTAAKNAPDLVAINHFVYNYAVIEKIVQLYQQKMQVLNASVTDEEVD